MSNDPANHQLMVGLRARKIEGIAREIPPQQVTGKDRGDLLVIGWGSTYGAIAAATEEMLADGHSVAHAHLRYLNPFPANLGELLRRYRRILVPENNSGHLRSMIRDRFLVDAQGLQKVEGRPFRIREIRERMEALLGGASR